MQIAIMKIRCMYLEYHRYLLLCTGCLSIPNMYCSYAVHQRFHHNSIVSQDESIWKMNPDGARIYTVYCTLLVLYLASRLDSYQTSAMGLYTLNQLAVRCKVKVQESRVTITGPCQESHGGPGGGGGGGGGGGSDLVTMGLGFADSATWAVN